MDEFKYLGSAIKGNGECGEYREKNAEDGAARQEEKRKAKEEARGCGEGGRARGWCDRGRRREQREMEDG